MKRSIAVLASVVGLAATGHADGAYMSSFDALVPGADVVGVDGWQGWDGVASSAGVVSSDVAYEGSNSLLIRGYTDAVQTYAGATSGVWSLQAKQYIPSGQSGSSYFIVMNRYVDGGNTDGGMWSSQIRFNLASGGIYDDLRGGYAHAHFDSWNDIRIDIDLDANTIAQYYNDDLIAVGTWTRSGSSALAIAAIDLYSGEANSVYYDNISLTQTLTPVTASADVPSPGTPGAVAIAAAAFFLPMRRRTR